MQTYSGHCHCGAIRFRFQGEPITTGCRCNCSICTRKGSVMSSHYIEPENLLELTGQQNLSIYRFGDLLVNHYFCKDCGVYPFHDAIESPGRYRINLGCIDGIDIDALEISQIDGRSF